MLNYNEEEEDDSLSIPEQKAIIVKYKRYLKEKGVGSAKFSEEEYLVIFDYYMGRGDYKNCNKIASMAYKQHPYSAEVLTMYADILITQGHYKKIFPTLISKYELYKDDADINFMLARCFQKENDPKKANIYLKRAAKLAGEEKYNMFGFFVQDYIDQGHYTDAIRILKSLEKKDPTDISVVSDIAFCYDKLGQYDNASKYYNKSLDINPFDDGLWFSLGTIHARDDKDYLAIEAFEYGLALNDKNKLIQFNLAVVYLNTGENDKAITTFLTLLDMDPSDIIAQLGLANAYLDIFEYDKAKESFSLVLENHPNHISAILGIEFLKVIEELPQDKREAITKQISIPLSDAFPYLDRIFTILPQLKENPEILNIIKRESENE